MNIGKVVEGGITDGIHRSSGHESARILPLANTECLVATPLCVSSLCSLLEVIARMAAEALITQRPDSSADDRIVGNPLKSQNSFLD